MKLIAYVQNDRTGCEGFEDVPAATWEEAVAWAEKRVLDDLIRGDPSRRPCEPDLEISLFEVAREHDVDARAIYERAVETWRDEQQKKAEVEERETYERLKAKYEGAIS